MQSIHQAFSYSYMSLLTWKKYHKFWDSSNLISDLLWFDWTISSTHKWNVDYLVVDFTLWHTSLRMYSSLSETYFLSYLSLIRTSVNVRVACIRCNSFLIALCLKSWSIFNGHMSFHHHKKGALLIIPNF